jgi:hypothetical protein
MTTTTLDFKDALWLKLHAYLDATDAKMGSFVRRAVSDRIDAELAANPGVKQRYEAEQAQLLAKAGNNIALIGQKRKPRKKPGNGDAAMVGSE